MNKNLSLLALTGTLALGGFLGFELSERSSAQVGSVAPVTQSAPAYRASQARTESEQNTVDVVKQRQDGLVLISVTEKAENSQAAQLRQQMQEQFPFNFGQELPFGEGGQGGGEASGTGSGFFVNAQGDIITNNHVVEGADEITIQLHGSKTTYKAKVIGRSPDFDLALIRAEGVPASAIKPIPLGDSSRLDVGLKAIALGAPFGLDFSVSEGIISSLERTAPVGTKEVYQKVIQTDAAINPGNSGGPLLDSAGQVIGVNTQILTGGSRQSAGVGFAIPVNTVKSLLPQLQKGGELKTPSLGIQFADLSAISAEQRDALKLPAQGALVQRVMPNSPAAAAGLQGSAAGESQGAGALPTGGDIITAIDGQPITTGEDLRGAIMSKPLGSSARLSVLRGGQQREVTVHLQAYDFAQTSASPAGE